MISVLSDHNIEGVCNLFVGYYAKKNQNRKSISIFRLLKIDDESFMDGYIIARKFISGK